MSSLFVHGFRKQSYLMIPLSLLQLPGSITTETALFSSFFTLRLTTKNINTNCKRNLCAANHIRLQVFTIEV